MFGIHRKTAEEPDGRLDALAASVAQIQQRLDDLEKPVRDLELEWLNYFEKFRNLYARLSRREERQREREEITSSEPVAGARVQNPLALELLRSGKP